LISASEAFLLLNLEPGSSVEEIRKAWRQQSVLSHPDTGGSNEAMIALNNALEVALEWIPENDSESSLQSTSKKASSSTHRLRRDVSSFTVNVLPVDCWHGLEIVASLCGPTVQDDPPYLLEFLLHDTSLPDSLHGWCRCECVPEAGGTTVHLTVGSAQENEMPNIDDVRDYLVAQLNNIEWPS
jgi:hypothetical protein